MALITKVDALRPILSHSPRNDPCDDADSYGLDDLDAELKRLAVANDEILGDLHPTDDADHESMRPIGALVSHERDQVIHLQRENAELKARLRELEAAGPAGHREKEWLEQQREYEMLLEEKSEVIRTLHQKIQDLQESVGPHEGVSAGADVGQAEEILRLKRELEAQRQQLDQDEQDMMAQLCQTEMTMARERAEMARQRQELSRLQADLAHEIEHASRDAGLKERLQNLRRVPGGSKPTIQLPPVVKPETVAEPQAPAKSSSSFFRRLFG